MNMVAVRHCVTLVNSSIEKKPTTGDVVSARIEDLDIHCIWQAMWERKRGNAREDHHTSSVEHMVRQAGRRSRN